MGKLLRGKLLNLVSKYGSPLYVYDAEMIRKCFYELLACFEDYPKTKLYYAMKANYNPEILKILKSVGSRIDAVSPAEVHLALELGFDKSEILFTANMLSNSEIKEVGDLGVLFNIGSLSELKRYGEIFPATDVCIRLNPDVVAGHHEKVRTGGKDTKFGICLDQIHLIKEICSQYQLRVVGLHEHTGSGIPETVDILSGLRNLLAVISKENFPDLRFVDFGGGFKVPYHPNEMRFDYKDFGIRVCKIFKKKCEEYGRELEMYFEPGRYLVAESGYLLMQANTVKENSEKKIVGCNSGFPQLIRPMFYDAYHIIENISAKNRGETSFQIYDVAGNICETGDYFAVQREVLKILEGDILCIKTAGAYCYSMGGVYNLRSMPSEILIDGDNEFVISLAKSSKELALSLLKK